MYNVYARAIVLGMSPPAVSSSPASSSLQRRFSRRAQGVSR